jgi:hypothetical protein
MVCPRDIRFPAISNSPPSDVTAVLSSLASPTLHFPLAASPPLPSSHSKYPHTSFPRVNALIVFFSNPRLALLSRPRLDSRAGPGLAPPDDHLTTAYTRSTSVYAIVPSPTSLRSSFFFSLPNATRLSFLDTPEPPLPH